MPAKKNFDAELNAVIEDQLKTDPLEHLGQQWAVIDGLDGLAAHLGVALKTLQRRIAKPPYKHRSKWVGDKKYALLRIRAVSEPEQTAEEVVRDRADGHRNTMAKIWLKRMKKKPTEKEQKLLWGFALELGKCLHFEPPEVFEFALNHWTFTAGAIKQAMMATPNGKVRYYDFPSIAVMRRFHSAVLYAYVMHRMDKGNIPKEQQNDFAMLLQINDFEPPLQEPTYSEDHIESLIAAKAAKKAAMKAQSSGSGPKLATKFFTKPENDQAA